MQQDRLRLITPVVAEHDGPNPILGRHRGERPPALPPSRLLHPDTRVTRQPRCFDPSHVTRDTEMCRNVDGSRRFTLGGRSQTMIDVDGAHAEKPGPTERSYRSKQAQRIGAAGKADEERPTIGQTTLLKPAPHALHQTLLAQGPCRDIGPVITHRLTGT